MNEKIVFWFEYHWSFSQGSNWRWVSIGSGNDFTWTKADPGHWCICAASMGDRLNNSIVWVSIPVKRHLCIEMPPWYLCTLTREGAVNKRGHCSIQTMLILYWFNYFWWNMNKSMHIPRHRWCGYWNHHYKWQQSMVSIMTAGVLAPGYQQLHYWRNVTDAALSLDPGRLLFPSPIAVKSQVNTMRHTMCIFVMLFSISYMFVIGKIERQETVSFVCLLSTFKRLAKDSTLTHAGLGTLHGMCMYF